jgi:hypothetical protein
MPWAKRTSKRQVLGRFLIKALCIMAVSFPVAFAGTVNVPFGDWFDRGRDELIDSI